MNSNTTYRKLIELKGKPISVSEFQDLLEASDFNNTIFVQWETNEGNVDYYEMYWEQGPIGTTPEGEKMTATKTAEGMFNIQCKGVAGHWRTLDLSGVIKCRFENKLYYIV
jgi:hypothetical protein